MKKDYIALSTSLSGGATITTTERNSTITDLHISDKQALHLTALLLKVYGHRIAHAAGVALFKWKK